ncbi:MAG: Gfo/Idh/MocA family oxidoreductase [Burkholderiaceae bacterium]
MPTLRIAVAGAGLIGLAHIAALRSNPDCALHAIVDPASAAAAIARSEGVSHYTELAELLAGDRPDGIILATPNALHLEQGLACMEAGIPTLLEKPITQTVAQAEQLVAAVERSGAKMLIGHHRAHSPIMDKARAVVDSGVLGRLVAVTGSATFYKPDHYFAQAPWRSAPGGGPILINMIHEVHNLRMLCGEITAVQAFASRAVRGFPVEDTVAVNLRFASGCLGSFMLSDTAASARSWEQTSQENPSYPSYDDEDCYALSGTNGTLAIPTMRLKTYPRVEDRSWWKPFETGRVGMLRADPLARQIAHFCALIRGQTQPLVSARDGLANLRVTEAIAAAASSGATVDIPPS